MLGSANLNANVTFVSGVANASHSSFIANPNTAYADGNSYVTFYSTVQDQFDNPVSNTTISYSLNGNSTYTSGTTDANGQYSWSLQSSSVSTYTVTANFNPNIVLSTVVQFTTGPVSTSKSSFTVNSTDEAANNSNTITATLTLRDTSNRTMQNQNISFGFSGVDTTVNPIINPTNSSGIATATYQSSTPQNQNATASVSGSNFSTFISFSGNANTFVVTNARGGISGVASSPNVTAYDSGGRIAVGYTGSVSFASSDANALVPATYTFTSSDRGSHLFASGLRLITPGTQSLTATDSALSATGTQNNLMVFAGYYYTLSPNSNVGMCAELAAGNIADGTAIVNNVCTSSVRQHIYHDSNNTLRIQGMCIAPSSYASGASIVSHPCTNSLQQQWGLNSNGQYQSLGNTSYCLDSNLSTANSGMALISCDATRLSQQFFQRITPPAYRIGLLNSIYVMDNASSQITPNNPIQSWQENNTGAQRFVYDQNQNLTYLGFCVDFPGSPPASGVYGVLNPCNGSTTQKFLFSGNNILLAANTNLCIDFVTQSSHALQARTCSGNANQKLVATAYGTHNYWMSGANPNQYLSYDTTVSSKLALGRTRTNYFSASQLAVYTFHIMVSNASKYLQTNGGTSLSLTTYADSPNQVFNGPVTNANNFYSIKFNNNCLDTSMSPIGMTTCSSANANQSIARIHAGLNLALSSNPNYCLGYTNNSYLGYTPIQLASCNDKSMGQQLSFLLDGTIRFSGLCATAINGIQTNSPVVQSPCLPDSSGPLDNQNWVLTNYNYIQSAINPNYCWFPDGVAAGANIIIRNCGDSNLLYLTIR